MSGPLPQPKTAAGRRAADLRKQLVRLRRATAGQMGPEYSSLLDIVDLLILQVLMLAEGVDDE